MGITLREDEKIIYEGKASWWNFWAPIVLGMLLLIWVIGIFFLVYAYLARLSTEYIITNKRLYSKYGLISRIVRDTTHDKIQDTAISQGIFGRIFNFGDLRFNTAGGASYEIVFKGVSDPMKIREYAKDMIK